MKVIATTVSVICMFRGANTAARKAAMKFAGNRAAIVEAKIARTMRACVLIATAAIVKANVTICPTYVTGAVDTRTIAAGSVASDAA